MWTSEGRKRSGGNGSTGTGRMTIGDGTGTREEEGKHGDKRNAKKKDTKKDTNKDTKIDTKCFEPEVERPKHQRKDHSRWIILQNVQTYLKNTCSV